MSTVNCIPNFFLVGAAKCGTTSLVNALSQHPDVYSPRQKEPMYFVPDVGVRFLDEYLDLFKSTSKKIIGDGSTGYLYYEKSAELIFKFNPNAKILIVLRNPINAAYSLYRYMTTFGNEQLGFIEAIKDSKDRKNNQFKAKCVGWYANYLYIDRYIYSRQIKRYMRVFSEENLKIVLFEELIRNPENTLSDICRFLGIHPLSIELPISNESGIPKSRFLKKMLDKKGTFWGKIIPKCYRSEIRVLLSRLNTSSRLKVRMTRNEREFVRESIGFHKELDTLESMLGISLGIWRDE